MCFSQSAKESNVNTASPYTLTSICCNGVVPLVTVPGKVARSVSGSAAAGGDAKGSHCAIWFAEGAVSGGAGGFTGDHNGALLEVLVPGQDAGIGAHGLTGDHAGICLQCVLEAGGMNSSTMRPKSGLAAGFQDSAQRSQN